MRAWRAHRGGYGSGGSGMERAFGIVCSARAESGCGKQPSVAGCKKPLFHGAAAAFLPACGYWPVSRSALDRVPLRACTCSDESAGPWSGGGVSCDRGGGGRTAVSVRTVARCNTGVRVDLKGAVRSRTGLTGFAIRGITALLPRRNQAPLTKKEGKRLLPLFGNWSGKRD